MIQEEIMVDNDNNYVTLVQHSHNYTNNTNTTAKTHHTDCPRRTPRLDKGKNPDMHNHV